MEYKKIDNGSYNLHLIKTNKFRNIKTEVYFRNNVTDDNVYRRTFLFDMLVESNKNYQTKRDIVLKCENLYNASLYSSAFIDGKQVSNSIELDILNPKYTQEDYYNESFEFLFDIIFNPNIELNEFSSKSFDIVKNRHLTNNKRLLENAPSLSVYNAIKKLDKPSSCTMIGTNEEIENITVDNLVGLYNDIMIHDYVDIFVIGDIDIDKVIDLVTKYAKFNTIKTHDVEIYASNFRKKPLLIRDSGSFNQSQIVFILSYDKLTLYERKYVAFVYNQILGGGSLDSKLYKKLRDENSLCYSVRSVFRKYDSFGYITTSVDKKNIDESIDLIKDVIKKMKNISEEDLSNAKNMILSSLNSSMDIPERIIDNYYYNDLGYLDPYDERVEKYKNVSINDVKKLINKIHLNMIYILEGDLNEKN